MQTLRVASRLVVVDVVVLDKAGHPVVNLDRSHFSITENKVPQALRSFESPSAHALTDSASRIVRSSADMTRIGNSPVAILVLDELNTRWAGGTYARQQMERYLSSQPEILPLPTLLVATSDTHFTVLHDYTQRRAELLVSLRAHQSQYPGQMMRGGSGNTPIDLMEQTLGALSQIAESVRGIPGRKNVLWVGSGYPAIDTTALQFDEEEKLMAVIRRVTGRMMTARINLSIVDPSGVQTSTAETGQAANDGEFVSTGVANSLGPFTGRIDFGSFAKETGGEIFANRNDVDVAIAAAVRDGNSYYTLSYVPSDLSREDSAYRKIRVTLTDPSLHVVARAGYFPENTPVASAPTADARPAMELKFDIVSAARSRLVYSGLKIEADRTAEGYTLLLDTKALHYIASPDGERIAEVTVMTVFFNEKEKELKREAVELKEKIANSALLNDTSQVALKLHTQPPAGTARVRFVVRDASTGVLGTADTFP